MEDYRVLIIRGIKEAVPQNQNIIKVLGEQQGKEETPTEWLEKLRRNMRQDSSIDPETEVGQTLLKVTFVMHAWPDIRRKLQKLEDWLERGLSDLLREAQKVHVAREEERMKFKAMVMAAALREWNRSMKSGTPRQDRRWQQETFKNGSKPGRVRVKPQNHNPVCFHCKKRGHLRRNCPWKEQDREVF